LIGLYAPIVAPWMNIISIQTLLALHQHAEQAIYCYPATYEVFKFGVNLFGQISVAMARSRSIFQRRYGM
jgi:hypothetical protein